jgi:hypothetical protein
MDLTVGLLVEYFGLGFGVVKSFSRLFTYFTHRHIRFVSPVRTNNLFPTFLSLLHATTNVKFILELTPLPLHPQKNLNVMLLFAVTGIVLSFGSTQDWLANSRVFAPWCQHRADSGF